MARRRLFTSESVTEGHPDKVADQISDAILDAIIEKDSGARVAAECLVTTGLAFVAGEITTETYVDIPTVVRSTIEEIGYVDSRYGLDHETCAVITSIDQQSPDIAMGVDTGGAGDQGMMFGYATRESPELMPLPIILAHHLTRRLAETRKSGEIPWLRPDGKSQVTVEYEDDTPVAIQAVVVSAQHDDEIENGEIRERIRSLIIEPAMPAALYDKKATKIHINPTGRFVTGGPQGDAGLTGRKIIVDTYGGMGRHGGGAFSGKDPTKVDRSASYAARWIAKNIVAAELADVCEVQLAYAIGVADPVSVLVDTRGSGRLPDARLEAAVREVFDLKPRAIIEALGLLRPLFKRTAAYGHFGREPDPDGGFSWERTDRVDDLKAAIG
ncbi:MAG: methionine adenosyltransferase [Gemmatimonadota bacterium]|nr:MAG: methionine adenosyltransferase [Gemmatimonadota bacterium]